MLKTHAFKKLSFLSFTKWFGLIIMRYVGLGICHLTFTLLITTQITFLLEESMAHEHEIIQIYLSPSKCFVWCDLVKKKKSVVVRFGFYNCYLFLMMLTLVWISTGLSGYHWINQLYAKILLLRDLWTVISG